MRTTHLTCNQAMVLLDLYRGTFARDRHMGTVDDDCDKLFRCGLVTPRGEGNWRILPAGEDRVKEMMG